MCYNLLWRYEGPFKIIENTGVISQNFGQTIYRHEPINQDDYIDVLFLYWVKDPTSYEHDDFLFILDLSQLYMIYMYIYMLVVLGVEPEAHD